MIIGKQIFKSIFSGAVYLTLMLAASNSLANGVAPNPLCVMADDFGDKQKEHISVKSTGEGEINKLTGNFEQKAPSGWLDTHVTLIRGTQLQIKSSGTVSLCTATPEVYPPITSVSTRNKEWQSTGITMEPGWNYSVTVSGKYSRFASSNCPAGSAWNADCYSDKGNGLFMYAGDTGSITDWNAAKQSNHNFLEMFNKGVSGYNSIVYGQLLGPISFRYADGDNGDGYDTDWAGNYSDNRGAGAANPNLGYTINITRYKDCTGINGQFLVGYIGDSPGLADDQLNPSAGGNIINLNNYAKGDDTTTPPRGAGWYDQDAPASGKLWLKIIDTPTANYWGDNATHGDGLYAPLTYTGGLDDKMLKQIKGASDANGNIDSSKIDVKSIKGGTAIGSNSGVYTVDIVADALPKKGFSDMLNNIVDPIRKFVRGDGVTPGLTERMYRGVTGNIDFIAGVRAAMSLAIVFFAFSYMVGLSNITQKELFALVVKLSIVITMIGPTSWEFFYKYLFSFFIDGTDDLIRIMTSQFQLVLDGAQNVAKDDSRDITPAIVTTGNQTADTFSFLNQTMTRFFTKETIMKILGLFSAFPIGFIMGILMFVGMIFFFFAIMKAMLLYLISIIMVALLLFVAPIFITFLLFDKTKGNFDKWIKQLMSFSLQPILLFSVLAIFNVFIFSAMYTILSYNVCWQCLVEVDLPLSEFLQNAFGNFDKFCMMSGYAPWGMDGGQEIGVKLAKTPVGLFMVFIFFIICNAMLQFLEWAVEVAGTLTAGVNAVSGNKGVASTFANASKIGKASTGMAFGAAKTGITKLDALTGYRASDAAKKTSRAALDKMGGRSTVAKTLLGGGISGGSDGLGGKAEYSKGFRTHAEEKALRRQREFVSKLPAAEGKAFVNARKEEYAQSRAKVGTPAEQQARRDAYDLKEKNRNNLLGSNGPDAKENAKFLMKAELENPKGTRALINGLRDVDITNARYNFEKNQDADNKNMQFKTREGRDKYGRAIQITDRVRPENPHHTALVQGMDYRAKLNSENNGNVGGGGATGGGVGSAASGGSGAIAASGGSGGSGGTAASGGGKPDKPDDANKPTVARAKPKPLPRPKGDA
jgi:type IV secretory pathway VirB6-like protein